MASQSLDKLLKRWSDLILQHDDLIAQLTPEQIKNRWAGEPPASAEAIAAAEARLERKLPSDYKAFLQISNGWKFIDEPTRSLSPVEEIDYLHRVEPHYTTSYGAGRDDEEVEGMLSRTDFKHVVRISIDNDGFFLLNPRQVLPGDAWQAYFFANWVPGEEAVGSFADLLQHHFDAFTAARGGVTKKTPKLNLKKPPAKPIDSGPAFLAAIEPLGFFDRTPAADAARIRAAFLEDCARMAADPTTMYREHLAPGRQLLDEATGRTCVIDVDAVAEHGARPLLTRLRPLLAARGLELPVASENRTATAWTLTLEGATQQIARLKNGKLTGAGMDHPVNIATLVSNEVSKLLNRWLADQGAAERLSSIEDFIDPGNSRIEKGFMVLSDELSYHFMWSGVLGCYCRIIRADVW